MRYPIKTILHIAFISAAQCAVHLRAEAKIVRYELEVTRGSINLSGKEEVDFALMMNKQIPAPTLEFTDGDEAEILVKNRIPGEEVSIHWHGILLPTEMDGVPYVTTPPIHSGQDHLFKFKIRQHGTYWYHSHTNVQEQKGLYGAFIIHPRKKTFLYDRDLVAVLSDWSDENAGNILKNLRKDGDYYLYKKDTVRSWYGALQARSLGNYFMNEWTRMGGMDLSDVGYDAFLVNGKREMQLSDAKPGEKIRLRLINAAASSYFHVSLGQRPMKVIAADGVDVEPVLAKEILMGMAETYDVLFEVPERKNYELRVTVQDGTGAASGWIGSGEKVHAPQKPMPDMYATMDHSGGHEGHGVKHGENSEHGAHQEHAKPDEHAAHRAHQHHGHSVKTQEKVENQSHQLIDSLTVDELKAHAPTAFDSKGKVFDLKLVLGGDMERYVWHINGKAIHQDRTIHISEGDVVRFTFQNETMMHHPMHLHGHFFRVLNKHDTFSPLKHTVDVPPHGSRVIEFLANEPGEWMLHCHNLYHLKNGMARVVKYMSYTPRPEIAQHQKHDPHLHDHWYFYGSAELATNHAQTFLRLSQTWNQVEARVEGRHGRGKHFTFTDEWEVEGDLLYRRWFSQYLNLAAGGTVFDKKASALVGVGYVLPFLIEANLFVNHRGKFRIDLEKRFQWTKWFYTDVDFSWRPKQSNQLSHDVEYEISLMFSPSWSWAVGLMFADETVGGGAFVQF